MPRGMSLAATHACITLPYSVGVVLWAATDVKGFLLAGALIALGNILVRT